MIVKPAIGAKENETILGAESLVENFMMNETSVTEGQNLFSNIEDESQNLGWVKKYKTRNERLYSFQNESICLFWLAFIAGDEIKKLKKPASKPGPDIEELIEAFEAYTNRHNSINDLDKLTTLKMSVHSSMGDARIVFSSILDIQINEDNITYNEVVSYLRRAYVPTHSVNFFRATKHFL